MRIAIIGTGSVGAALARGLAGKGYDVTLGTRHPEDGTVHALAAETGSHAVRPSDAVVAADAIILALPWSAVETAVAGLGDLSGKIVIDCTNPLGRVGGTLGLTLGHTTSGGEVLQALLPEARVVKTLNQVGAEIMARNAHLPHRPVLFMAGNDASAKTAVAGLLRDLGFDPHDAGAIDKSRLLEPFALLWINQALARGKGRDWAFAAVSGRENRPMTETLSASCHCGAVRLTFPATAAGVLACHCGDCQKMHGSFNAFLAAPIADVALDGAEALVWYQSSETSRRAFCGTCGARVLKEVMPAGRWLISAGLIDGPSGKRIIRNLWEQSKPDWYDLPEVVP